MLLRYVPHFIALSASSPFQQGEDTSYQSSRLNTVSAFPLSGQMPFVHSWAEFAEFFEKMRAYGIVESMKDFYWDVRPKPEYGTVEIRVCDTPLTVRRAALLAAYAQALSAYCLEERAHQPSAMLYRVNTHNRFEASRYGLRGQMVDAYAGESRRIGDDILETIAKAWPHATRLGAADALNDLAKSVRQGDSDAQWMRLRRSGLGSLSDAVREACARWKTNA